jgi:hypothetical protein
VLNSGVQQQSKTKRVKRSSENKKLVFLSQKVLEEVSSKKETTGTLVSILGAHWVDSESHSGDLQAAQHGKPKLSKLSFLESRLQKRPEASLRRAQRAECAGRDKQRQEPNYVQGVWATAAARLVGGQGRPPT